LDCCRCPWAAELLAGQPRIKKPAAAAAGIEITDLIYCFVIAQTTADFGVV